jgi:hypothetical protein
MKHVSLYRVVEDLSAAKVAAAGAGGAGVSLTAASIDPGLIAGWMQVTTLAIGALTGLASFVLVALKLVQQRREMRKH